MNEITVNGEKRLVAEGTCLSELVAELGLPGQRIAIELNEDVIRKKSWGKTNLSKNDVVEVVHFVGGG